MLAPVAQRSLGVRQLDSEEHERLEPDHLGAHIDALYRAAYALSGSRHDAEDLVQETFARVLMRPRFVRSGHELRYLLRALRNTYYSRRRADARRPATAASPAEVPDAAREPSFTANEIMRAVASASAPYRDAVIAVDILGMSYQEAASALRTREPTVTTRLHRGRRHVARVLLDTAGADWHKRLPTRTSPSDASAWQNELTRGQEASNARGV